MCGGAGWAAVGCVEVGSTWGESLSCRNGSTRRGPEQGRNLQVLEVGSRNGGQEGRLEALARGSRWPGTTETAWLLRSPKHRLGISGTAVSRALPLLQEGFLPRSRLRTQHRSWHSRHESLKVQSWSWPDYRSSAEQMRLHAFIAKYWDPTPGLAARLPEQSSPPPPTETAPPSFSRALGDAGKFHVPNLDWSGLHGSPVTPTTVQP